MSPFTVEAARQVLRDRFGYPDFRPAQRPAVEAVLSRRDALIVLPTGGGKSLCFQVPALLFPGLTLVISPLISLMEDQVQALQRRGISAEFINSTLAPDEVERRVARIERGELKLLYVAPERLAVGRTVSLLSRIEVSLLAVDEAHCVSRWGHDFRPSYLRLPQVRRALGDPQTVALTATATPAVRRDMRELLGLREPREVIGGFDRDNLHLAVVRVRDERERRAQLLRRLTPPVPTAVVYAATRLQVERVVRVLRASRVPAIGYHAGLGAERRARAQEDFMRGLVPVIVATNAFGMGIDKSDVRLVLHVAASGTLKDYYQEAGRAGRDGGPSRCVLLYKKGDRRVHDRFRSRTFPPGPLVRQVFDALLAQGAARTPVVLDPVAIGHQCRPAADPAKISRSLDLLRQWEILEDETHGSTVSLRVIALRARLRDAASVLAPESRVLAEFLLKANRPFESWVEVAPADVGLTDRRLSEAITLLEARQLACARRDFPMGRVVPDRSARGRLASAVEHMQGREGVERAKLDSVVGYATTRSCRRAYILRYFGEIKVARSCRGCDNCTSE